MDQPADAITATLGVFSGRRNPQLTFAAGAAESLAALMNQAIGKERGDAPPAAKLGRYYGFLVRTPAELARRLSLPEQLTVYRATVSEGPGREQRHWVDRGKVEGFLLNAAEKEGHGDLLRQAGAFEPK